LLLRVISDSFKKKEAILKKQRFLEIVRFCISGGIGVILGYATLYILTEYVGLWYLLSSMTACALSYTIGFIMQKFWAFKNRDTKKIKRQIFLYLVISVLFFVTNTGFMYVFVDYCHIQYIFSQIILTIILSIISYITTKKIFAH